MKSSFEYLSGNQAWRVVYEIVNQLCSWYLPFPRLELTEAGVDYNVTLVHLAAFENFDELIFALPTSWKWNKSKNLLSQVHVAEWQEWNYFGSTMDTKIEKISGLTWCRSTAHSSDSPSDMSWISEAGPNISWNVWEFCKQTSQWSLNKVSLTYKLVSASALESMIRALLKNSVSHQGTNALHCRWHCS